METTGIAGTIMSAGEVVMRQGLIEHAQKRLADAEKQHKWLERKINPENRKLADMHRKALDATIEVMALLSPDLPADRFLAIHVLLMESMDRVAEMFGSAIGWQGGKAGTGKSGGNGKIKKNREAAAKATAKAHVRELWKIWQDDPGRYKGKAAFARDMLDKYPDELTSQPVIERWCRDWKKEKY